MYETVLWATDGSALSDGALTAALELLAPDGRLIAFHSDERFMGASVSGLPVLADEDHLRDKLRAQVDELRDEDIDVRLIIETTHHHAAGVIAKAAEDNEADVIVCGTRGFGLVAGAVAGSVAMRLPHLAVCPVVVVSQKAACRAALATARMR
jgi:nucleotide-binding universal stress UspA family protein